MREILYHELWNKGRDGFVVYGFFTYPEYSVLAGQTGKRYLERVEADTPEEAMRIAVEKYGEMNWGSNWTSASVSLDHLPDQDEEWS
jgi:hypothetical protein